MQKFSEIISIFGVLVFCGGVFWLRGPAVSATEIWYGVVFSAVGALLFLQVCFLQKIKKENIN